MYIPRPAKLLFTVDDGWNRYLGSNGDSITPWTRLCVERMLACGTAAMGVRRYCCASADCPTPAFSARAASQRPAAPAASKPRSSGCRSRATSSPTATGSTLPLPCPICYGRFLTTTGPYSTSFFRPPPGPCSAGHVSRAWKSASSAPCIPTAASSTSIRTFMSPSHAADLM